MRVGRKRALAAFGSLVLVALYGKCSVPQQQTTPSGMTPPGRSHATMSNLAGTWIVKQGRVYALHNPTIL